MGVPFPQQQPNYYAQANMPQQPNVRFFAPGQMGVRGGQPRWPQQGGRPQGQMMMPNSQFQRSRGPNPRMNFANMANMQRPGGAPMMAPMMAARPGMPPQGMPQVQPNPGMAPNMRATNANYKYTAGVRNVAGSAVPVTPQPVMQTQVPQAAVFIQGMSHVYKISIIFKHIFISKVEKI